MEENNRNTSVNEIGIEKVEDIEIPDNIKKTLNKYLIKMKLTPSKLQTKMWRNSQAWYVGGKKNECEIYQRGVIEEITNKKCHKTSDRINMNQNNIISETRPMKRNDAFDWTEDFDGKQGGLYTLYYNFKMVVGSGGAQTRSLREVAHFITAQLDYNLSHMDNLSYFVNILDGDESCKLYTQYNYILNKQKYKHVKQFTYIGDTYGFIDWFNQLNVQ